MKLAIITPAFSKHLPLLEMSAEAVDRYCPHLTHYIIVSGREYHLFRHLDGSNRQVLIVEDLLTCPVMRLPVLIRGREIWLLDWRRPLRGWIMQQIIKICAPEIADADVFLFLDTDIFFIRRFDVKSVARNGRVRLWTEPGQARLETHMRWHRTASKLLGLPVRDYHGANFIGNLITWRRDIILEMRSRISALSNDHWVRTIAREYHMSEYILYGVFVQELLGKADLRHLPTNHELCCDSWTVADAQLLTERLRPSHIAVNIQSNLDLPVSQVRALVDAAAIRAAETSVAETVDQPLQGFAARHS